VLLQLPTWEDFVAAAVDEISFYASSAPSVLDRVGDLLDDLASIAPPSRRDELQRGS
jgi:hypothetical protein